MKDINFLLNENIRENQDEAGKKKGVNALKVIFTVFIILVGVVILFIPGMYAGYLESRITSIEDSMTDKKYAEVTRVKAALERINTEIEGKKNIIKAIDAKSLPASQVILMAEQALPDRCFYSVIDYTGSSLKIKGKADAGLTVAELMANLDRLNCLAQKTQNAQFDQTGAPVEFLLEYTVSAQGGN